MNKIVERFVRLVSATVTMPKGLEVSHMQARMAIAAVVKLRLWPATVVHIVFAVTLPCVARPFT